MSQQRRRFSRELKLHILAQIEAGQTIAANWKQLMQQLVTEEASEQAG